MSRHASPTAQLLRNSRLFSLPQPLPRPIVEQTIGRDNSYRSSDSATTPFPLRQAIITPSSSASRGDWGLKRSLPPLTTKRSSEPVQTIIANDTYESITEYAQASGHVKTLQKFQELGIAMVRQDQRSSLRDRTVPLSALDPAFDYTDKATAPPAGPGQHSRWKYKNHKVRNMTPGEFQDFLEREVKGEKDEFMRTLQARAYRQKLVQSRLVIEKTLESNDVPEEERADLVAKFRYAKWVEELPAKLLNEYIRDVQLKPRYATMLKQAIVNRSDLQLSQDDVFEHATPEEIDSPDKAFPKPALPNFPPHSNRWKSWGAHAFEAEKAFLEGFKGMKWDADGSYFADYLRVLRSDTTLASRLFTYVREFLDMPGISTSAVKTVPAAGTLQQEDNAFNLSTHPTAGLSYLRTNNKLANHPILGPQAAKAPVKARVISQSTGKFSPGIAGFVANPVAGKGLDFQIPGGAKVELEIGNVYVDGEGKIRISTKQSSDNEARGVRDGLLEQPPLNLSDISGTRRGGAAISRPLDMSFRQPVAARPNPLGEQTINALKQVMANDKRKERIAERDGKTPA